MAMPTIFDVCQPRNDIIVNSVNEADYAADLARVLKGDAPPVYQEAAAFFANTYPTRGLTNLFWNIFTRLGDQADSSVSSIFRLDTTYGGGKTHALIALSHAAREGASIPGIEEFIDPAFLPSKKVAIAAFDGENADPANGRLLAPNIRAFTPWGELAYALGGEAGYELMRKSDEMGAAPGAELLAQLIGDKPTLILLDELAVYLRKAAAVNPQLPGQLAAFLTALFKAVEGQPHAALVYTLAVGKDGENQQDAYGQEHAAIASAMNEAASVSARKATVLDPTGEDETIQVLRRRLFSHIDEDKAVEVVNAYIKLWDREKDNLPSDSQSPEIRRNFYKDYPFHPEMMAVFTEKTSTLGNFQRTRGMLRILAGAIARLWATKPPDVYSLQLGQLDLSCQSIRQEIITRLGQTHFWPALKADIAAAEKEPPALAAQLDEEMGFGKPYTAAVAQAIFFHTLAYNDSVQGASPGQLRYGLLSPGFETGFINAALDRFKEESAYLDDKPGQPLRFLHEPNLNQLIRQQEKNIDADAIRALLTDTIQSIFREDNAIFNPRCFVSNSLEVPDDGGKPSLVVLGYEACSIKDISDPVPELAARIYQTYGNNPRVYRNNLLILVADRNNIDKMKIAARRMLALEALNKSDIKKSLPEHQKHLLEGEIKKAPQNLNIAIQTAYRHLYYPSRPGSQAQDALMRQTIEYDKSSAKPGKGQQQIVLSISGKKLRRKNAEPDSPDFLINRTRLKTEGKLTTGDLAREYRSNPQLCILEDNSTICQCIANGIKFGDFVYRKGDLVATCDTPEAVIQIADDAEVMTQIYVRENNILKKPEPVAEKPDNTSGVEQKTDPFGKNFGSGSETVTKTPGPALVTLQQEGPLAEVLTRLWEKIPANGQVINMRIAIFNMDDAFALISLLRNFTDCGKKTEFDVTFKNTDGSDNSCGYKGSLTGALAWKDFLPRQLRCAINSQAQAAIDLAGENIPSPARILDACNAFEVNIKATYKQPAAS